MEAMILLAAISLVVGFVVGVLSGLLGIGGGVFLVPIFKLGYLMEPMMCTATSLRRFREQFLVYATRRAFRNSVLQRVLVAHACRRLASGLPRFLPNGPLWA